MDFTPPKIGNMKLGDNVENNRQHYPENWTIEKTLFPVDWSGTGITYGDYPLELSKL